VKTFEKEF